MGEASPIRQRRQHERLYNIIHRRRIRTRARDRAMLRELLRYAYMLCICRPRHQPAKWRERILRDRKSHPSARGRKREITFTRRAKPVLLGYFIHNIVLKPLARFPRCSTEEFRFNRNPGLQLAMRKSSATFLTNDADAGRNSPRSRVTCGF